MGKELLQTEMTARNINCRPVLYSLSSPPADANYPSAQKAPELKRVSDRINWPAINLPFALSVTEDRVRPVCESLKEILERRPYTEPSDPIILPDCGGRRKVTSRSERRTTSACCVPRESHAEKERAWGTAKAGPRGEVGI